MWLIIQVGIKSTGAERFAQLVLRGLFVCFAALDLAVHVKLIQFFPVAFDLAYLKRLRLTGRGIVLIVMLET